MVGWGPTVRELDFLAGSWEEVVHVACLEPGPALASSLPYTCSNIRLEPIPISGGERWREKLTVLTQAPAILRIVRRAVIGASHVQIRVPMGIGLFLLPWFALRRKSQYQLWVKYANNWGQADPPLGYGLQRWFLHKGYASCPVTLNGRWPGQPAHCLSFENPCLYDADLAAGAATAKGKVFQPPFRLAFTGRLEEEKGVKRILDALDFLGPEWIDRVDFIGDGPQSAGLQSAAARHGQRVQFHGFRAASFVHEVLQAAHFFVLPTTASEGFPKVVAEAACHGCIPVVSDVSSLPQYVHNGDNGFVWSSASGKGFEKILAQALETPRAQLQEMAMAAHQLSKQFTMERYLHRLKADVFGVGRQSAADDRRPTHS